MKGIVFVQDRKHNTHKWLKLNLFSNLFVFQFVVIQLRVGAQHMLQSHLCLHHQLIPY